MITLKEILPLCADPEHKPMILLTRKASEKNGRACAYGTIALLPALAEDIVKICRDYGERGVKEIIPDTETPGDLIICITDEDVTPVGRVLLISDVKDALPDWRQNTEVLDGTETLKLRDWDHLDEYTALKIRAKTVNGNPGICIHADFIPYNTLIAIKARGEMSADET